MSGTIGSGPPQFDKDSYDTMRKEIEDDGGQQGDHVRGRENGTVYLHKGVSSGFGLFNQGRRDEKFEQGGDNMFKALSEKVGPGRARQIFSMIRDESGRDPRKEFMVDDFQRVDHHNQRIEDYQQRVPIAKKYDNI